MARHANKPTEMTTEEIALMLRRQFERGFPKTSNGYSHFSAWEWVKLIQEQTELPYKEAEELALRVAPEFTANYWDEWMKSLPEDYWEKLHQTRLRIKSMNFPTATGSGTSYIRTTEWIDGIVEVELVVQNDVSIQDNEMLVYSKIVNISKKADPWRVSIVHNERGYYSKAEKITEFSGPLLGPINVWFGEAKDDKWPMIVAKAARQMWEEVAKQAENSAQDAAQPGLF